MLPSFLKPFSEFCSSCRDVLEEPGVASEIHQNEIRYSTVSSNFCVTAITQAFVEMSLSHFTSQHDIHLVLRSAADKQVIKIPVNYHVAGTCSFVLIANKCFHEKAYQILRLTAFLLFRCSESTDAHSILPSRQHFCLPSGLFPRVLQPKPFLLRILEVPGSNLGPSRQIPG